MPYTGAGCVPETDQEDRQMKHMRPVTRKPALSQISNFEVFKEFLINLTDQLVEYAFIKTS